MNDASRREQRCREPHRAYIILMKRTLIHAHVEPSEGDRYRFIMLRGKPHRPVGRPGAGTRPVIVQHSSRCKFGYFRHNQMHCGYDAKDDDVSLLS